MAEQKQSNKERLREITEGIEQGIKELFESEKYRQYLSTMSRFHRYSVNNTMLIYMQMPDATLVAGYNKWRDQFERHVKRGERGITIIAPTPYRKKIEEQKLDPDTKAPMLDAEGKVIIEEKTIEIPMFKPVKVFDVSQTDGKPLPHLASDLTGNVQQYDAFLEALRRTSPVPIAIRPIEPDTDGFFSLDSQSITIREGMSEVQTVSAVVHEITHALLHNDKSEPAADNTQPVRKKDRHTEEVEAESVSYAVCQYFGIQTGENSFGYIATWSQGKELKELRESLETINKTANQLITDIDRHFKEICKERGIDLSAAEQSPVQAKPEAKDAVSLYAQELAAYLLEGSKGRSLPDVPSADLEGITAWAEEKLRSHDLRPLSDAMLDVVTISGQDSRFDDLSDRLAQMNLNGIPQGKPESERSAKPVYQLVSNFQRMAPEETTCVQEYIPAENSRLIPGAVLYVGTHEECLEIQSGLRDGTMTPQQVKAMEDTEKLFLVADSVYLHVQHSEDGFDYTLYDKEVHKLMDGGQLNNPDLHISTACLEICKLHELDTYAVKYAPVDMIATLQNAQVKSTQRELLDKLADHFAQEDDRAMALTLDEYPMPDPQLTEEELEAHSYLDGDMLPLSRERAMELYDKDFTVYAINGSGEAEMIFDAEDFDTTPPNTLFALERSEWEHSDDFHQQIMQRLDRQELRERAFLEYGTDCFAIYQQPVEAPGRFRSYDEQKGGIQRSGYRLVYTGELNPGGSVGKNLNDLWYKFNQEHPADYHFPSLSVSDIVALKVDGVVSCHYVDSIGYKELPDFIQPENYLRNAEMTIEDDYNMIDGIINNGPRQPALPEQDGSKQEVKKKSVVQQLKQQPKQSHKKTAHRKGAEQEL